MKRNHLRFIVIAFFIILSNITFAQKGDILITGKVVESRNQSIEFATIMVMNKTTQVSITGGTTNIDGNFELESKETNIFFEVSFIGYTKKTINDFEIVNGKIDLGTIILSENEQILAEVEVRAEQSQTVFKLDKRVFNVGKDLSSTGASAYEVLNNVPSVNVNIEGEISLRGNSGVQILINGKPSVIGEQGNALGTITAAMIEKVEVITNPSAKYEAAGTSGIINIILKKEERKGINGSISLNTGLPQNHSLGLSLNRRTEKVNLFTQIGIGYRKLPGENENINRDLVNNNTIYSEGEGSKNEQFYNFTLGMDYYINPQNVLTLSGDFAYELEDQPSRTNFSYEDANGDIVSEWYRSETTEALNPKYQYELQYKSDFKDDEEHVLLFSALGDFFGKNQSSEFEDITISGIDRNNNQRARTDFQEAGYTFKLDYTKPFSEKFTLETGAQYVIQDVSNDFAVTNLENGEWVDDAGLTNIFEYNQNVLGVYGTAAYEHRNLGVKVGLRFEDTDLNTLLVNTNESNKQSFNNFFPSTHISYKVTDNFSLQTGYSRRIYRPHLWDLNPFFSIRNNFNIRVGNPNLQPQFTDSYELSSIYILDKMSMNASIYYAYTTEVIDRIAVFENNVRTFKPFNIGIKKSIGLEFNTKITLKEWLTLNGDFYLNRFTRQGELEGLAFDFSANQWSTKWTSKFKLPKDFDFEVTGLYRSAVKRVQGTASHMVFANVGLRKKIFKGKAVLNLSVRDVFASRIWESENIQTDFYTYHQGSMGRFITLGFSYGFGKGAAMQYSGQKH